MTLSSAVSAFCTQYGWDRTYWIAYSGGLDSHVLLALCAELRAVHPIKLCAVHINHGLSPHAEQWAAHCRTVCADYGIPYTERTIEVLSSAGDSLEETARTKRYAVFASCLNPDDILLTAHHEDDQAETVLLQLFRGAGLNGLAAMPAMKSFAGGWHGRPLLRFSRLELENYAREKKWVWIEDESNQDTTLTRNFIRHEVLARLKTRWPTISTVISRSAIHCAEAQALLEESTVNNWQHVQGSTQNTLSVAKLLCLSPAHQRLILREWIRQSGHVLPNSKKLETILKTVLTADWDRLPCVKWGHTQLRRYRDDLYLLKTIAHHDAQQITPWSLAEASSLLIPGIGCLQARSVQGRGLRANLNQIRIQFRQGGEVIAIQGRGRRRLKQLFHEWGVLPWQRDRIPLIFYNELLVGVVGYFMDERYAASEGQMGYELALVE